MALFLSLSSTCRQYFPNPILIPSDLVPQKYKDSGLRTKQLHVRFAENDGETDLELGGLNNASIHDQASRPNHRPDPIVPAQRNPERVNEVSFFYAFILRY